MGTKAPQTIYYYNYFFLGGGAYFIAKSIASKNRFNWIALGDVRLSTKLLSPKTLLEKRGDFRADILCPPTTKDFPKRQQEAGRSELFSNTLSQISYRHTGHCKKVSA